MKRIKIRENEMSFELMIECALAFVALGITIPLAIAPSIKK